MDKVMDLVRRYNLILLEDCCDALGSTYDGNPLGSYGEISTCSFYPAHHITAGEGGFVACRSKEVEKVVRSFREWGRSCWCVGKKANLSTKGSCGCRFKEWIPSLPDEVFDHKYVYGEVGYNMKPIELQCSILLEQMDKLPVIREKRISNYNRLMNVFRDYEDYFILPRPTPKSDPSWFAFPLTIRDGVKFKRSDFCRFLEDNKIQTRNYFGGNLLLQPAYSELANQWGGYNKIKQLFPNATKATTDTFFLGVSPVITNDQLDYVGGVVDDFMARV
jgi:CDP-6-deoxy-D-xylo-4-hexulose-3-dehydrase